MKKGTWNVVKAKMTCKQRRHILRRAATGPKYHQGYNTYCNIDVPLAFTQFSKYCESVPRRHQTYIAADGKNTHPGAVSYPGQRHRPAEVIKDVLRKERESKRKNTEGHKSGDKYTCQCCKVMRMFYMQKPVCLLLWINLHWVSLVITIILTPVNFPIVCKIHLYQCFNNDLSPCPAN